MPGATLQGLPEEPRAGTLLCNLEPKAPTVAMATGAKRIDLSRFQLVFHFRLYLHSTYKGPLDLVGRYWTVMSGKPRQTGISGRPRTSINSVPSASLSANLYNNSKLNPIF